VLIFSYSGSAFGRFLPSWYSDKVGRFNMLLLMAMFTLVSMLFIWLPFGCSSLAALYIFVLLYGFGTGSFVSLSMACVGQICRGSDFGRWIGAMDSVVSIAYELFPFHSPKLETTHRV
jgi:MFS family permease